MPISDAVTAGMSKTALTGAGMGLGSAALASAGGDSGQPVGERVGGRQFGVRVDQASRDREQHGQMAGIAAAAAAALMLPAGLTGLASGLKGIGGGVAPAASTALVPAAAGGVGYAGNRQRIPRSQVPPDPTSGAGQIAATPPAGLLPAPAPPSLFRPGPLLLPAPTRPTPPPPPAAPQEPQPSPWRHPNPGAPPDAWKAPQAPLAQRGSLESSSEDRVRVENREINPKGSKL